MENQMPNQPQPSMNNPMPPQQPPSMNPMPKKKGKGALVLIIVIILAALAFLMLDRKQNSDAIDGTTVGSADTGGKTATTSDEDLNSIQAELEATNIDGTSDGL